ncbi:MAG: hypothetical protein ACLQQ4_08940 [Bacteroidia bacterium]
MNRFYYNLDYTESPATLFEKLEVRGSKTKLLTFCMHVVGVYRLFDNDTVQEFLYRLALVFRHYNLVPKFFINDNLITFDDRGVRIDLCLDDIIEHLGYEIWDGPTDLVERNDWIGKIDTFWVNACKIAVFSGIPILDRRIIGKNRYIIGSNKPAPIDEECEKNAALFAQEALRTMGNQVFIDLNLRTAERKAYLEKYREHLATQPRHIYDYEKIPMRVKKKIFRKLYGSIYRHRTFFREEVNETKSTFAALVHLAWLWGNGYITTYKICRGDDKYAFNAEVDERVDFDYDIYDGLNKLGLGVNLYDTFYDYELDKITHLLKERK